MLKRAATITLILFVLLACQFYVPNTWDEDLAGYTVEPATPEDAANAVQLETTQIEFWQLPPRIMLMAIVCSFCPIFLFPLELIFFFKLLIILGFRKLARMNVLDNPTRMSVYCFIRNNPGTAFMDISRETRVGPGTLRYHLAVLKLMNKITVLEATRNTRYFENSGSYSVLEQKVLKHLNAATARNILELLFRNPNRTRGELEQTLGISGAGVNWHLHRLSYDGLLVISKDGRNARYTLCPEAVPFLQKYMPNYRDIVITPLVTTAEPVS
ncbi:MAG: winged helix-turn-helix transcriptional regulator [Methanoregula sp.]|jgi:predicted transcriptional regulator|nr:winged helix-turn-helix transcriptional regulator [Methanoregula sp.]